jgi:hypothetical protein
MEGVSFADMLAGGHPNSLGRTVEVVAVVLADRTQFERLYQCYSDQDEVVRLRTSSAMKRLWRADPDWFAAHIERFISEIAYIDQPSARWTMAQMVAELDGYLTDDQRMRAVAMLRRNLAESRDWIVIIQSLRTLAMWAKEDAELCDWLIPQLMHFSNDPRRSVSGNARKLLLAL